MAAFNKVILMGNLTADPEIRYTPQGTAVTDLRLAVNSGRKGSEETLFIDATVWDKAAEACAEFLARGRPVLVEGRLKMEEWDDKQTGAKRSKVTVTASNVQFLGSASEAGAKGQKESTTNQRKNEAPENLNDDFKSDDVPF